MTHDTGRLDATIWKSTDYFHLPDGVGHRVFYTLEELKEFVLKQAPHPVIIAYDSEETKENLTGWTLEIYDGYRE